MEIKVKFNEDIEKEFSIISEDINADSSDELHCIIENIISNEVMKLLTYSTK